MQTGTVYMTSIGDLDNPIMGVVLKRMWWKPWRYSLQPMYYTSRGAAGYISGSEDGEVIPNLTMKEAIGMMKLMGVTHKDFQDFLGEPK